jgi:putative component of toxin-antitoxin plasmid stabilization module
MNSIQTTGVFDDWFAGLKDRHAVRRIQVRIDRAEDERGMEIVILLAGGDKSTQSKDIKTALKIARQL